MKQKIGFAEIDLDSAGVNDYVLFIAGGIRYAISVAFIGQIIRLESIQKIPDQPNHICGVVYQGDDCISVIDINILFGGAPTKSSDRAEAVILYGEEKGKVRMIGIVVDAVERVGALANSSILPVSKILLDSPASDYASGLYDEKGQEALLIDGSKFLHFDVAVIGGE